MQASRKLTAAAGGVNIACLSKGSAVCHIVTVYGILKEFVGGRMLVNSITFGEIPPLVDEMADGKQK